jgi:hypothetical protein
MDIDLSTRTMTYWDSRLDDLTQIPATSVSGGGYGGAGGKRKTASVPDAFVRCAHTIFDIVARWLDETLSTHTPKGVPPFHNARWTRSVRHDAPQQAPENVVDCGVYMLAFARHILRHRHAATPRGGDIESIPTFVFSDLHVGETRREFLHELLTRTPSLRLHSPSSMTTSMSTSRLTPPPPPPPSSPPPPPLSPPCNYQRRSLCTVTTAAANKSRTRSTAFEDYCHTDPFYFDDDYYYDVGFPEPDEESVVSRVDSEEQGAAQDEDRGGSTKSNAAVIHRSSSSSSSSSAAISFVVRTGVKRARSGTVVRGAVAAFDKEVG